MTSVSEHPEWEAFVRSIRENPDDDLPRLVAADWLEEHGESARAELIRVQVELSHTPEPRTIEKNYGTRHAEHVCLRCDEGTCRYHDLLRRLHQLTGRTQVTPDPAVV